MCDNFFPLFPLVTGALAEWGGAEGRKKAKMESKRMLKDNQLEH